MLKEIRFHGRGGQGAVTAAYLTAMAAFEQGKMSQAFPNFGVERRGAPVMSFARISDKPVQLHSQIYEPDYVVVLDSTLINVIDVFAGLKKGGKVIINSKKPASAFKVKNADVYTVDASSIALKIFKKDIVNTALLAAFAAVTNEFSLDSLKKVVKEKFKGEVLEKNLKVLTEVYNNVR